jgi:hypothetical protein
MPFQVSSTAYGSPLTTMQDMRAWLSSLGVFKHTANVASSMRCSEGCASSCFFPWGLLRSGWGTCLACFLWIEQVRHSEREKKDILSGKLAGGRYVPYQACAHRHGAALLELLEGQGSQVNYGLTARSPLTTLQARGDPMCQAIHHTRALLRHHRTELHAENDLTIRKASQLNQRKQARACIWSHSTGARSSRMQKASRRHWGRPCTSAIPTIPGRETNENTNRLLRD